MSARATLKKNGQFDKEMAALAGEKVSKKLAARRKDYALMLSGAGPKAPDNAFHKPGSQK